MTSTNDIGEQTVTTCIQYVDLSMVMRDISVISWDVDQYIVHTCKLKLCSAAYGVTPVSFVFSILSLLFIR